MRTTNNNNNNNNNTIINHPKSSPLSSHKRLSSKKIQDTEAMKEAKPASKRRLKKNIRNTPSPISVSDTIPSFIAFRSSKNDNNDDELSAVSWESSESENLVNSESTLTITSELQDRERRKNAKLASRIKFYRIINSASSRQSTQPSKSSRSLSICDEIPSAISFRPRTTTNTAAYCYNNEDDGVSVVTTQSFEVAAPEIVEVSARPALKRSTNFIVKPSSNKSMRSQKKKVKNLVDQKHPVMLLSKRKNIAAVQDEERLHGRNYKNATFEIQ